jgi:hypothetical protein
MSETPKIVVRQFKSRKAYERDVQRMLSQGWQVQSMSTTESRRALGCLFGLVGYWLLPKRTVFHVTYVQIPVAIEGAPTAG